MLASSRPFAAAGRACRATRSFRQPVFNHKTSRRVAYEAAPSSPSPDIFDVLLWNERGELTEFTRGNLVLELDGVPYTPPQSAGLPAGTFRAVLLECGTIEERVLRLDDLQRATRVWLINSVREWVECSCLVNGTCVQGEAR